MKLPPPPPHLKLPFNIDVRLPFKPLHEERREQEESRVDHASNARQEAWLDGIKQQARFNVGTELGALRIAWVHRYSIPKHQNIDDYTLEELLLEAWEQHYHENPRSIELQGIVKRINQQTKYAYYVTGDPVIDALEKEFSEGKTPDLQAAFGHIKDGQDIFRSPLFKGRAGEVITPRTVPEVMKKNEKGEKVNSAGAAVEHDNYQTDQWVKDALEDDPVLKAMAEKIKSISTI